MTSSHEKERREINQLLDSAENEHNANNILASFGLLSDVRERAYKHKFTKEYVKCLNMLSRLYAYIDDFEEAIQLNKEGYEIAKETGDTAELIRFINNKGVILGRHRQHKEALNIFNDLLAIANQQNNFKMMAIASRNIAGIELELGNSDYALRLIDSLLNHASYGINENWRKELYGIKASVLYKNNNIREASKLYDSLLNITDPKSSLYIEFLRNKGLTEASVGNKDRALYYLHKANRPSDYISRFLLYCDYSKVYELTDNLKEAVIYKDSALLMMDSVHSFAQDSYHRNSTLRFNLLKKEEEAIIAKFRTKVWFLTALSALLILIIICLYFNRKRKVDKLTAKLELIKMQDDLYKAKKENSDLQNKIDNYIEQLNHNQLSIASRDTLMKEVANYLSTEGDSSSNKMFLAKMKSISNDTDNLDSFLNHTRQMRPELFSNLVQKHPSLNQNDLKYISLVFLQLSVNEIATILNITPAASKKRKQRICSKIGLDSTIDLYSYLLSI